MRRSVDPRVTGPGVRGREQSARSARIFGQKGPRNGLPPSGLRPPVALISLPSSPSREGRRHASEALSRPGGAGRHPEPCESAGEAYGGVLEGFRSGRAGARGSGTPKPPRAPACLPLRRSRAQPTGSQGLRPASERSELGAGGRAPRAPQPVISPAKKRAAHRHRTLIR